MNNRLIAYIDILGFRQRVIDKDARVRKVLNDFVNSGHKIKSWNSDFGLVAFSDTIVIYSKANNDNSTLMWDIINLTRELTLDMFNAGIPIRGVIHAGEIHIEKNNHSSIDMYWGLGFIEAHDLEKSKDVVGLFISSTALGKFDAKLDFYSSDFCRIEGFETQLAFINPLPVITSSIYGIRQQIQDIGDYEVNRAVNAFAYLLSGINGPCASKYRQSIKYIEAMLGEERSQELHELSACVNSPLATPQVSP